MALEVQVSNQMQELIAEPVIPWIQIAPTMQS